MKNRSPIAVLLLPFITFGIYSLYWEISTKIEMNKLGAKIPTAWLIIIPFVNIWWLWKYCEGVEQVTHQKFSGVLAFVLLLLLGWIGQAIIQDSFNKTVKVPVAPNQFSQSVPQNNGAMPIEPSPSVATPVTAPAMAAEVEQPPQSDVGENSTERGQQPPALPPNPPSPPTNLVQ